MNVQVYTIRACAHTWNACACAVDGWVIARALHDGAELPFFLLLPIVNIAYECIRIERIWRLRIRTVLRSEGLAEYTVRLRGTWNSKICEDPAIANVTDTSQSWNMSTWIPNWKLIKSKLILNTNKIGTWHMKIKVTTRRSLFSIVSD